MRDGDVYITETADKEDGKCESLGKKKGTRSMLYLFIQLMKANTGNRYQIGAEYGI